MSEDRIERFYIEQAMARRKAQEQTSREIYCCTICNRVQPPTTDRNIRCASCKAPLLRSLERITDLRRSIKYHYKDPESIKFIQIKIRLIRSMRNQYAELNKFGKRKKKKEGYVARRKRQATTQEVLDRMDQVKMVFHITDPDMVVYKLTLKNKKDIESMYKHAAKMRGKVEYKGTVRELDAMEDIRKAIIDVGITQTEEKEKT